jgi:hypothetical protein
MALDEFGLGANWLEEEEERRKRTRALGIGAGPVAGLPAPLKRVSRAPSGTNRYVPFEQKDRNFFKTEAQKATVHFAQGREKAHKSQLSEFFSLSKKMGGQEKVAKRLEAITSLWNVYAGDYDGRNAIWLLLKSPYTVDTIEGMLRRGGGALYGAPEKGQTAHVPARFAKATGIQQNDWLGAAWGVHYANLDRVQGRESLTSALRRITTPPEAPMRAHQTKRQFAPG